MPCGRQGVQSATAGSLAGPEKAFPVAGAQAERPWALSAA